MKIDFTYLTFILQKASMAEGRILLDHFIDADHDRGCVGRHIMFAKRCRLVDAIVLNADNDPYYCCEIIGITQKGKGFLERACR